MGMYSLRGERVAAGETLFRERPTTETPDLGRAEVGAGAGCAGAGKTPVSAAEATVGGDPGMAAEAKFAV